MSREYLLIFVLAIKIGLMNAQYSSKVVNLSPENWNLTEQYRLAMVQFTIPQCKFSQKFRPTYRQLADIFAAHAPKNTVLFGNFDCEKYEEYCDQAGIDKYPTLKILRYGRTMKREYRGPRTFEDIWKFITEDVSENILYVDARQKTSAEIVKALPSENTMIGAVFHGDFQNSEKHEHFKIAAYLEKDNCEFFVVHNVSDPGDGMALKEAMTKKLLEVVSLDGLTPEQIQTWMHHRCVAAVRELTSDNAEEIIAENRAMMILFYGPKSKDLKQKFYDLVRSHFQEDRKWVNFLTADGQSFAHPLSHMNRTPGDVPLICIDSLRHMYELPANVTEALHGPSALRRFLNDFYSGNLHYEFHRTEMMQGEGGSMTRAATTTPVESAFKKYGPSNLKYTMKHEEL